MQSAELGKLRLRSGPRLLPAGTSVALLKAEGGMEITLRRAAERGRADLLGPPLRSQGLCDLRGSDATRHGFH